MRLELQFELEKLMLPSDYRRIFISYLKNALSHCNHGMYYERYFSGTEMKDYTFSLIFTKPDYQGEVLHVRSPQVKMIFSADDKHQTGILFFQAFILQKEKRFPLPDGNGMVLKKIYNKTEQQIISNKVIFKTVTGGGLVIRDHCRETNVDKYVTIGEEGFDERMKEVLKVQALQAGFSETLSDHIKMKPIQCRKVVARVYGIYIDVTVGLIQMEADPRLLQYFYQSGMGSKHSLGFGMVDLVTQDLL